MTEYQNQKATKPKVEDIAMKSLDGDKLKNLLDLLEFLKANKLTPRWRVTNAWAVNYKGKMVCDISINSDEGSWLFRPNHLFHKAALFREKWFTEYNQYITDNELKIFVWNHLHNNIIKCKGNTCEGIRNKTILEKNLREYVSAGQSELKTPKA